MDAEKVLVGMAGAAAAGAAGAAGAAPASAAIVTAAVTAAGVELAKRAGTGLIDTLLPDPVDNHTDKAPETDAAPEVVEANDFGGSSDAPDIVDFPYLEDAGQLNFGELGEPEEIPNPSEVSAEANDTADIEPTRPDEIETIDTADGNFNKIIDTVKDVATDVSTVVIEKVGEVAKDVLTNKIDDVMKGHMKDI